MIRARTLQKRVEIHESTITADGFGGNIASFALAACRWCNIEDLGAKSYQNIAGITDFTNTLKFTFRYDLELKIDPKDHILKYQGLEYEIIDVKTDGFKHVQQIVIAKQILGLD